MVMTLHPPTLRRYRLPFAFAFYWFILAAVILRWNLQIEASEQQPTTTLSHASHASHPTRHLLADVIVNSPPPASTRTTVASPPATRPQRDQSPSSSNQRQQEGAGNQQKSKQRTNGKAQRSAPNTNGARSSAQSTSTSPRDPRPKRIQPKKRAPVVATAPADNRAQRATSDSNSNVSDESQFTSTTPATKKGTIPPRTSDIRADASATISQIIGAPAPPSAASNRASTPVTATPGRPTVKQVEADARLQKQQAAEASRLKNNHLGRDHGPMVMAQEPSDAPDATDGDVGKPTTTTPAAPLKKILPHKFRGSAATTKSISTPAPASIEKTEAPATSTSPPTAVPNASERRNKKRGGKSRSTTPSNTPGESSGEQKPALNRQKGTVRRSNDEPTPVSALPIVPASLLPEESSQLPEQPETENLVQDHPVRFVAPGEAKLKQSLAQKEAAELADKVSKVRKVPISSLVQVGPVTEAKAKETPIVATPEQLSAGGGGADEPTTPAAVAAPEKPKSHSDTLAQLREKLAASDSAAKTESPAPKIVETTPHDPSAPFFVAGVVTPDVNVAVQTVSHVDVPVVVKQIDPETGHLIEKTEVKTEKRVQTHEIDPTARVSVSVPKPPEPVSQAESQSEVTSSLEHEQDTEQTHSTSEPVPSNTPPSSPPPKQSPAVEELTPAPVAPVTASDSTVSTPPVSQERPSRADGNLQQEPVHEPEQSAASPSSSSSDSKSTERESETPAAPKADSTSSSDDSLTVSEESDADSAAATPTVKVIEDPSASTVDEVIKAPIVKDHTTVAQPEATTTKQQEQTSVEQPSSTETTTEAPNTSPEAPPASNETKPGPTPSPVPVDSETSASTLVETQTWKSIGPAPRSSSSSGLVIVIVLLSFLIFVGLKLKRCLAAGEDGEDSDDLESGQLLHNNNSSPNTSKRPQIRPGSGQVVVDALTDEEDPEERYNKNKAQRAQQQDSAAPAARGMSLKMAPTKPQRATSAKKGKLSLGARQLDSDDD